MSTLDIRFEDDRAIVTLNRPKANALNQEMVSELRQELARIAEMDKVGGVILTGRGSIFSAGLDVVELFGYDEQEIDHFWQAFGGLMNDMVGFPKPLIAAINGHAPAGGCVLALCCDYRVMAEGNYRIGLNEVPVGVVPPATIAEVARYAVGAMGAEFMLLNGVLMLPGEALGLGLVHEIAEADNLMEQAQAKLDGWLKLPREPWLHAKRNLRRPLLEAMNMDFTEAFGATIRGWWSENSRAQVRKLVEKLSK